LKLDSVLKIGCLGTVICILSINPCLSGTFPCNRFPKYFSNLVSSIHLTKCYILGQRSKSQA
jgi:hypothetical protein